MSAKPKARDDDPRRRHRPKGAEQARAREVEPRPANDEADGELAIGRHSQVDAALFGSQRETEEPVAGKVTRVMRERDERRARDERRRGPGARRPAGRLAAKAQSGRSLEDNRELLEQALVKAQEAGGGTPLDAAIAKLMQTVLGAAFDNVKVHTNPAAAEAARLLGARAFTLGNHIFFGDGQYAPGTDAGDRLLRHELTHVVQHARGELAAGDHVEIAAESSAVEVEARAAEHRTGPARGARPPAPVIHDRAPTPGMVARKADAPAGADAGAAAGPKEWKLTLLGQALDLSANLPGAKENSDGTKTIDINQSVGPLKIGSARFKPNGDKIESATLTASIDSGALKGTSGALTVNAEGKVFGNLKLPVNAPGMLVKEISVAVDAEGLTGKAKLAPGDFATKDFGIKTSDVELTVTRSATGAIEVGLTGTADVTVENGMVTGAAKMAIALTANSAGVTFQATITGRVDIKGITETDAVIKYDGKTVTFDAGASIPVKLPGIAGTARVEYKAGKLSLDSKDLHFTLPQLAPIKFENVHVEKGNLAAKLNLSSPINVPLPGGASLSLDKSTIEIDGGVVKGDITGTFKLGNAGGLSATASLHYDKGGDIGGSVTVTGGANAKIGPVDVSIANGSKLTIVKSPTDLAVEGDITGKVKIPGIKAEITAHVVAKKGEPIDLEVDAKIPLAEIKKELGGELVVKYKRGAGAASTFEFEATSISVNVKPIKDQVIFSSFKGKLEGKEITGRLDAAVGTTIKAAGATVTIGGGHVELLPGKKLDGALQASVATGGAGVAAEAKVAWKDDKFEWSAEALFELSPLTKDVLRGKVRAAAGSDGSGKFTSEGAITFGSPALAGVVVESVSGDKEKGEFAAVISAKEAINKVLTKVPTVDIQTTTARATIKVEQGKVSVDGTLKGALTYPKTGDTKLKGNFELGMSEDGGFTGKVEKVEITAGEKYFKSKDGSADLETGIVSLGNATFEVPDVAKGAVTTANINLKTNEFDVQADVDMTIKALRGVKLTVKLDNNQLDVKMREGTPPIPLGFADLTIAQESTVKLAKGRGLSANIVGGVEAKGLGKGKFAIKYENKDLSGNAQLDIEKFAMFAPVHVDMRLDKDRTLSTNAPIVLSLAADYATLFDANAKIEIKKNKFEVEGNVTEVKNLGKISEAFKQGKGGKIKYADGKVSVSAEVDVGGDKVIPELATGSVLKLAYDGSIFTMAGTLKPKAFGPVKFTDDSSITASWTSATKRLEVNGAAHADVANLCQVDFTVAAGAGGGEPGAFALKGKIDATKLAQKLPGVSFSSVTADFSVLVGSGKQADLNFHVNAQISGIPAAGITNIKAHIDANYASGEGLSGEFAVTEAKLGDVIADGKITLVKNKFSTGQLHVKAAFPALTIEGTGVVAAGEMNDLNTTADLKVTPGGGSALATFVESGNIHVELKKWKLASALGQLHLKPPSFLPIENPVIEIGYTPEAGISAKLETQFDAPMAKNGEKGTFVAGYQRGRGLYAHIEFPLTVPGFQSTTFAGDLDSAGIRASVTLVPKDAKIIKQAKIEIGYDFKTGLYVQGSITLTPTESLELEVGVRYDGKGLQVMGIDSKDKDATSDEHEVAGYKKKFPTIPLASIGVASLGLRFSMGVAAGYRMPKIKFKNPQLEGGLDALEKGGMPAFTFGGSIAMGAYVSLALSVEVVGEIQLLIATCSAGIGAEIMARLNLELGADVNGRFAPGEGATLTIDPFVGASLDLIASLIATLYAEVCWFTLVDKKWTLASATFAHIDLPSFRPFKPLGLQFGGPGGTRLTQGLALRDDAFDQIIEGVKEGGKHAGDEEANRDAKEKVTPVLQAFKDAAPQFEELPPGWENGMVAAPVHFNAMFPVSNKEWDYYQDNADTAETNIAPALAMRTPTERLAKAVAITARRDPFGAGRLILAWRRAQIAAKGFNPDTGVNVVAEREIVQSHIQAKYEADLAAAAEKQAQQDAAHAAHVAKQGTDFTKASDEHTKAAQKQRTAHDANVAKTTTQWTEAQQAKSTAAKQAQQEGAEVAADKVEAAAPPPPPPAPAAPKPLAPPAPIPVPAPVPLPPAMEVLPAVTMPALPSDPGVSPSASMTIAKQKKPAKVESPGVKEAPKGGAPDPKPGATPNAAQAAGGGGGTAPPSSSGGGAPKAGGGTMTSMPPPGPAVMAGPEGIISQNRTLTAKDAAATGKPAPGAGGPAGAPAGGAPAPAAAPGGAPAGGAPAPAGAAPAPGGAAADGAAPGAAPGGPEGAGAGAGAKGPDAVDPTVKAVADAGKTDTTAYDQQLDAQAARYQGTVKNQNQVTDAEKKKLEADAEAAKQKAAQDQATAGQAKAEQQAQEAPPAAPAADPAQAPADPAQAPADPAQASATPAAPGAAPGAPAPAAAATEAQAKEADAKIKEALLAVAVQPPKLGTMSEAERIALGAKLPPDVRKLFYPDWATFVGALSALQTTKVSQLDSEEGFEPGQKDVLVGDFKAKALASFHADGKDITAMFTTTARGGFLFQGKKLTAADLDAAVPADGLGRCIGSGAVEGAIKADVVKTDWLAAHAGQPAPPPEVLKAWAMEQLKAAPRKIETYADGPALVKYPGWVFPTPDIKTDAVFSQYCDLLALYANWYPQGHIRMTIKRDGVVKKAVAGQLRKPTVFDGMQSPLWVQRDNRDHNWGVTGGGLREALMQIDWADVDHARWLVVQTDAKYKAVLDAHAAEEAAKKASAPSDPANAATVAAHQDQQLADAQATQAAQTAQDNAAKGGGAGATAPAPTPTPSPAPAAAAVPAATPAAPTSPAPAVAPAKPELTVPKSLAVTPVSVTKPSAELEADAQKMTGAVEVNNGGDPATATQSVIAHTGAKLDQSTGVLSVPAKIAPATLAASTSVQQLANTVASQLGVSKVKVTNPTGKKLEITIAINPEGKTAEVEVLGFGDKYFFVGRPKGTAVEETSQQLHLEKPDQSKMVGDETLPGYVVQMVTTPGDADVGMATKYTTLAGGAWKDGRETLATARTGVVVGVNTFKRLDEADTTTAVKAVDEKVPKIQHTKGSVLAVFGFTWEPTWEEKGKGPVPLATVREAYAKLSDEQRTEAKKFEKDHALAQAKLPYGALRNAVTDGYGKQAAAAISSKTVDPVHLVTQDADGALDTEGGKGLLAAYDDVLIGMERQPLLTIGGYRFKGFNWGTAAESRKAQLTELANELDRVIREYIAKVAPQALYPTEPNMLVKAIDQKHRDGIHDRGIEQGFGAGMTEGRTLGTKVLKANAGSDNPHPDPILAAPSTSIVTSPVPGPEDVNSHADIKAIEAQLADPSLTAESKATLEKKLSSAKASVKRGLTVYPDGPGVTSQEQNFADPETAARETAKGVAPGMYRGGKEPLLPIFQPQASVAAALGSTDPNMTPEQQEEQVAAARAQVDLAAATTSQEKKLKKFQAEIETARIVAQAVIDAMTGPELRETWEKLRKLFTEIEAEAQELAASDATAKPSP